MKRKNVRIILAVLTLSAINFGAIAQFSVTGKIFDSATGKPLAGANVVISGTRYSASSSDDGTYFVSGIEAGLYNFKISYIGYKTLLQEVEILSDRTLDFKLDYIPVMSDEVIVESTRVKEKTPFTYSTVDHEAITRQNTGQDLPYILQLTPSVITSSDAGAGIGYTGIRIRGTDITRINVTMNGVPVNDAESHDVFFVDLPDLASSVDNMQIQRGVGTSSNGAAAFGASINIETTKLNPDPYAEINSSAGSFSTFKNTIRFGSGLLGEKWAFDGRVSAIHSDGYIERGCSTLKSFYFSGGYFGKKTILKAIVTSGWEKTYQAWYGTPKDSLATNRRYNPSGAMYDDDGNITDYYKNQTDNYRQDYYQLHFALELNKNLNLTSSLFYTKGKGYYESFKNDEAFADYGLEDLIIGTDTISTTDLINQKWLDNDFYGLNVALNYSRKKVETTVGGGWNSYHGDHFGYIIWAEYAGKSFIDQPWYENTGQKTDINGFVKINYQLNDLINLYGDLQMRNIHYSITGTHDDLRDLTQKHDFIFFNPKGGVFLTLDERSKLFTSVAVAHREPNRSAYRDADPGQQVSAERLTDYEIGYNFRNKNLNLEAIYYFMDYKDQLVLTGQINNVGDPILVNVPKSYRTGIELSGGIKISKVLRWDMNLTLSRNRITDFVSYTDNWDTWPEQKTDTLGVTDISFSPDIIGGSSISWSPFKTFSMVLQSKFVGRQFIDNTSNVNRSLDPYFVNDLKFYYTLKTSLIRQIDLMLSLNNIFNTEYETNAWVYRYYTGNQEYEMNGYFPQAKFNVMCGVSMKF